MIGLKPKSGSVPEQSTEAIPAMVFLNGRNNPSFRCECGCNVFAQRGLHFTCNGCGAEYEGEQKS